MKGEIKIDSAKTSNEVDLEYRRSFLVDSAGATVYDGSGVGLLGKVVLIVKGLDWMVWVRD